MILSIVIPVYNPLNFFISTIESILNHKSNDFELLLIDDGPYDRSENICQKYYGIDERVRVINGPNGGLCLARNYGIDNAKGDYIWFMDADDLAVNGEIDHLVLFLQNMKDEFDIIYANHKRIKNEKIVWESNYEYDLNIMNSYDSHKIIQYLWGELRITWAIWNNIYRKSFLLRNKIYFDKKLSHYEDGEFNITAALAAQKCTAYLRSIYIYRLDNYQSLTHRKRTYDNFYWAHYFCVKWYNFFETEASDNNNYKKMLMRLSESYYELLGLIGLMDASERRAALKLYKQNICLAEDCSK